MLERYQMNIIKNRAGILCMLIGALLSCTQKNNNLCANKITFSKLWKTDTLGCLGIRRKIIKDSLNLIAIKECKGLCESQFVQLFGKPLVIKRVENNKKYFYLISCGVISVLKNKGNKSARNNLQINTEASCMVVEIDCENKVKKIGFAVP